MDFIFMRCNVCNRKTNGPSPLIPKPQRDETAKSHHRLRPPKPYSELNPVLLDTIVDLKFGFKVWDSKVRVCVCRFLQTRSLGDELFARGRVDMRIYFPVRCFKKLIKSVIMLDWIHITTKNAILRLLSWTVSHLHLRNIFAYFFNECSIPHIVFSPKVVFWNYQGIHHFSFPFDM